MSGNDSANEVTKSPAKSAQEIGLERMEALLKQSALGIHILFDNRSIAGVLSKTMDDKDFYDFTKMKRVQDIMTDLVTKKTYYEKIDYVYNLDAESYELLVRTYFHIVENTVRASHDFKH